MRLLIAQFAILVVLLSHSAMALPLGIGEVVVSGFGRESGAGLTRIDPTTGIQTLISAGSFGDFALADRGTIYALGSTGVERVDVASGAKTTISSGGQLIAPTGIAVDSYGQVYVLDHPSAVGGGAIIKIDPFTGQQTLVSSGGLITSTHFSDLEFSPMGDLIVLDELPGCCLLGEIFAVDVTSGYQELLYDDRADTPLPGVQFLYAGTGMGVAPNGDIYVSNGFRHQVGVLKIDAVTGEASRAGSNQGFHYVDSDGEQRWFELGNTDLALSATGVGWMVGVGSSSLSGLFRWGPNAFIEDNGEPFSVGSFDEVQVVGFSLPIPEPGTALLVGLGLSVLGVKRPRIKG